MVYGGVSVDGGDSEEVERGVVGGEEYGECILVFNLFSNTF